MTTDTLIDSASQAVTGGWEGSPREGSHRANRRLVWRDWSSDRASRAAAEATMAGARLKGVPANAPTLGTATVLSFGLGAVGAPAFQGLARQSVGHIDGVDPDSYGPESFLTQPALWSEAGQFKADVQGRLAGQANPAVRVRTAIGLAQDVPLAMLRRADVWLAAGDNLELLVWLGLRAAELGKVLVQGAVHPETWTAIVRVFDLCDPAAACPTCNVSLRERQGLRAIEGCAGVPGGEPTRALSAVCGMAAQLATAEVVKRLLRMDEMALSGAEYAHSLLTHRGFRTILERNPACHAPHRRWELVDLVETVHVATPALLADRLGFTSPGWELHVSGELPWFRFAVCQACGERSTLLRFVHPGEESGRCPCGGTLTAAPQGQHQVVPADDLAAVWDRPLAELGVPPGGAVGLQVGEQGHYLFTRDEPPAAATSN